MFEFRSKIAIPRPLTLILIFIILLTSSGCTSLFSKPFDKLDQDEVKDIENVCLEIDVSVPWYEDGEVATSLENLFESLGLTVLEPEDQCDFAVSLNVSGHLSKTRGWVNYYNDNGDLIYSIEQKPYASAKGELIISLQGYQTLTHTIDKQGSHEWDVPFLAEVLDKLAIIWGDDIYWKALLRKTGLGDSAIDSLIQQGEDGVLFLTEIYLHGDSWQGLFAAEGLTRMGPDALAAVPYLIELLETIEEEGYPDNIGLIPSGILNAITGENFGEDSAPWRDYWEEQ